MRRDDDRRDERVGNLDAKEWFYCTLCLFCMLSRVDCPRCVQLFGQIHRPHEEHLLCGENSVSLDQIKAITRGWRCGVAGLEARAERMRSCLLVD